jgi:hypothetical protein
MRSRDRNSEEHVFNPETESEKSQNSSDLGEFMTRKHLGSPDGSCRNAHPRKEESEMGIWINGSDIRDWNLKVKS